MLRTAAIFSLFLLLAANADEHWAYERMAEPAVPKSAGANPIDHFVDTKLKKAKLEPAPAAAPHALYRRLSFNLTGLPPEPGTTKAFLKAHKKDPKRAITKATNELLASAHYGERQARLWLDVARYADSNGQDENKAMANAWRYRDWVVDAFNADMPYNDFVRRQLAGDLLETPDPTGTGFLVIGPKRLAEQDKDKMVFDIIDEQVDTTGRAFLATTLGCARCHDHKTDPVSHRDYFALAGIFKSTRTMADHNFVSKWNERDVSTKADRAERKTAEEKQNALNADLLADAALYHDAALSPDKVSKPHAELVKPVLEKWKKEKDKLASVTPEQLLAARDLPASKLVPGWKGGAFKGKKGQFVDVAHRPELEPKALTLMAWVKLHRYPEGADDRRWIINKNDDEWAVGHYALVINDKGVAAYVAPEGGRGNAVHSSGGRLKLRTWHHLAMTDNGEHLRVYLDGKEVAATPSRPRKRAKGHLRIGGRADSYNDFETGDIDEVRIYKTALNASELKAAAAGKAPQNDLVQAWTFDPESDEEKEALSLAERRELAVSLFTPPKETKSHWTADEQKEIRNLEAAHKAAGENLPDLPFVMAVEDRKVEPLKVQNRGEHLKQIGEPVPRGVPDELGTAFTGAVKMPDKSSGRRELVDWLTHPEHPLTARVIVNRVWAQHFGHGLVRSMDNFGPSGEEPTHPELLDWLARDFVRSGWSIKKLHHRIISSTTFQRGADQPEAMEQDPENRLLARVPRRRLEVEMVRDSVFAIAGTLDRTRGGSLTSFKNHGYVPKSKSDVFTSPRRALYLPIIRDRVHSLFDLFDLPEPSASSSERDSTVLPHQALFFFNSELVRANAKSLAERVEDAGDQKARVNLAHQFAFARPATKAEHKLAAAYFDEGGQWPDYCQALFASNEFLFLD